MLLLDLAVPIHFQFEYPVNEVTMRILSLKYEHIQQNITYTCDAGKDGYLAVLLQTITGEKMGFDHKSVRLVSEVGGLKSGQMLYYICKNKNACTDICSLLISARKMSCDFRSVIILR